MEIDRNGLVDNENKINVSVEPCENGANMKGDALKLFRDISWTIILF